MWQPLSGAGEHHLSLLAAWHGRLMVMAWGLLFPAGILIARYAKVTPRQRWPEQLDNKLWWRLHLLLQSLGSLLMLLALGLILVVAQGASSLARWHALGGWSLVAGVVIQVVGGRLRGSKGGPGIPGDHYLMTRRRLVFEYVHKTLGWLALVLSVPVVLAGLVVADAPRWMFLLLILWWTALIVLVITLQRRRCCLDTYQAIWGPADCHPGNRLRPIGWGVFRHAEPEMFIPTKTQCRTKFVRSN
ncbi:hypothetical protein SB18R_16595 [Pseudomonas oryzihabitans]|nr:hypothetical protein SB9_07055 [Pseudomonas psychrotolerans]KTT73737.1 hypothetical protein SB18R_16595 [Pseudomonas psychrotolerans]